jgi:hypothetical protein
VVGFLVSGFDGPGVTSWVRRGGKMRDGVGVGVGRKGWSGGERWARGRRVKRVRACNTGRAMGRGGWP